ncbi:MAG: hypothetical protein Q8M40_13990 [Legionella sp.]|nr:hypothetical protein [Legionella sp.]
MTKKTPDSKKAKEKEVHEEELKTVSGGSDSNQARRRPVTNPNPKETKNDDGIDWTLKPK